MKIGVTSRGILGIPDLKYFFSKDAELIYLNQFSKKKVDVIIGWGNKNTSISAKKHALKHKIPYLSLEDGFIRSLGPAKLSPAPLSIIFDDKGIYYDATQSSKLETLIIQNDISQKDKSRANKTIAYMKENRISKYNHSPEDSRLIEAMSDFILLIDQTFGDLSISGSLANSTSFKNMIEAAFDENPNSKIIVKTHPEVTAGYKQGYLADIAKKYKCQIIDYDINPWVLLEGTEKVYTVSSQMGFEALMANKTVRCFGIPFYAGWGLTIDEQSCERRNLKRTLNEVFTAAYLKYPVYLNPFTLNQCELEDILPILTLWKNINHQNRQIEGCTYISKWKQKNIKNFLKSTTSEPKFFSNFQQGLNKAKTSNRKLIAWASKLSDSQIAEAKKSNIQLGLMEDGFIRSVGLGVNLVVPQSIVVDYSGIYYDHHHPSDLENIIQNTIFSDDILQRADAIIKQLNQLEITKYNVDTKSQQPLKLPNDKVKILVVGQVENDASIKLGTRDIKTNLDLLKIVREKDPNAFIIYKPHPDVAAGQRRGKINNDLALKYADLITSNMSITNLLRLCDELHTLTSLAGFEALIRNKKVHCYGIPFYAGWGLTHDLFESERRTRKISLNELVAATLILYPKYLDPITNQWCTPEIIIERLRNLRIKGETTSSIIKLRKLIGKVKELIAHR